mmetsp:Transcript_32567/g.40016  ORF Transcript_32567/g.40016 Transcript_32567/m.40016 type:complete len:89 (+) Transcript_32567:211-477(+)
MYRIMPSMMERKLIGLESLLVPLHGIRTYGNPAKLASKVLPELCEGAMKSENNEDVVSKFMTKDGKNQLTSVDELIKSVQCGLVEGRR